MSQPDSDAFDAAGERVRREVLGDAWVDAAQAATTAFTAPFQEHVSRWAWAAVWDRPGLDRRTRSMLTLALLTALRAEGELPPHVRAARRNGVTCDEIAEVLLHAGVYAGAPAANTAFRLAQQTLAELGEPEALNPPGADDAGGDGEAP